MINLKTAVLGFHHIFSQQYSVDLHLLNFDTSMCGLYREPKGKSSLVSPVNHDSSLYVLLKH